MLNKSLAAAIGVAALIVGGTAMAAGPVRSTGNEVVDAEYARIDTSNSRPIPRSAPVARDDWEYVAGDTGWELRQHKYDFANGRLVHSDDIPHNTPKPVFAAPKASSRTDDSGG
jgi:hypothetical protein